MCASDRDRPIRILCVDDDPSMRELVSTYLERIDSRFSVATEPSAEAGIDRLESAPFDCVVSDYRMPGIDGVSFLRAVREVYPNLPFFLFTGEGSETVASKAVDAGATSYVRKGGSEVYERLANRVQHAVKRRRSARQARVTRERLLELYERVDGFYLVDEDWTVRYWNHEMVDRTGTPVEDVLGESLWDVFPEAVGTEAYERYREAMASREPAEFETRSPPPYDYWVEVRAYPTDEGLSVHSRDVTKSKEREQQLQYRNELLESFASTVSHDLRNPLTVAEGNLRLAQETGDFDHLEEVAQAHNRMRNLINELLHAARGDELDLSTVSLREIATDSWETVTDDGATLEIDDDVLLRAYESQLQRLFENLFWNALDHGDADEVRVGRLEGGFFVQDDGSGISPKHREDVFESGFSTDIDSPGYGLSIVDGIVDVHRWEIRVVEGADGGARFEVTGVETEESPRAG
ncbi:response regulator [Halorubrum cibi]|uniref:histidine kinase n=1 Tax=Halorubrum cibi TaxID=413815 RepID=A0A521CTL5_9EURY|nr:response regulator [Halorubrum cibi]SMO62796.1 PAS domain S-box-containing protein [Halorubrum cibi]